MNKIIKVFILFLIVSCFSVSSVFAFDDGQIRSRPIHIDNNIANIIHQNSMNLRQSMDPFTQIKQREFESSLNLEGNQYFSNMVNKYGGNNFSRSTNEFFLSQFARGYTGYTKNLSMDFLDMHLSRSSTLLLFSQYEIERIKIIGRMDSNMIASNFGFVSSISQSPLIFINTIDYAGKFWQVFNPPKYSTELTSFCRYGEGITHSQDKIWKILWQDTLITNQQNISSIHRDVGVSQFGQFERYSEVVTPSTGPMENIAMKLYPVGSYFDAHNTRMFEERSCSIRTNSRVYFENNMILNINFPPPERNIQIDNLARPSMQQLQSPEVVQRNYMLFNKFDTQNDLFNDMLRQDAPVQTIIKDNINDPFKDW